MTDQEAIKAEIQELDRKRKAETDPVLRRRLDKRIYKKRRKIDVEIIALPLSHGQLNGLIDAGYVTERSSDVTAKVISGVEDLLDDIARDMLRVS